MTLSIRSLFATGLFTMILSTAAQAQVQYVGGGAIVNVGSNYLTVYSGSSIPTSQARNVRVVNGQTTLDINFNNVWYSTTVSYTSAGTFSNGAAVIDWGNGVGFPNYAQLNLRINGLAAPTPGAQQIYAQSYSSSNSGCYYNEWRQYICD